VSAQPTVAQQRQRSVLTGLPSAVPRFAAMVPHWIPWAVLAWVWLELFLPNMLLKEASMSRYPDWTDYYSRTGMLLPWIPALLKSKSA